MHTWLACLGPAVNTIQLMSIQTGHVHVTVVHSSYCIGEGGYLEKL